MKGLNIKGAGTRALAAAREFTVAQRTIAIIGVAVLALGGIALGYFATRPSYSPLFTGLSSTDASAIVAQLQKDKVDYQLADGGNTILVPADKVDAERLSAASAGLPSASTSGYSLLDSLGVTASQFQENVTYKRAIEGELAKTIQGITGITSASVQLAIPEQTVYSDDQKDTTASVFVNTTSTLSDNQVNSIVHLVSSSVPGMTDSDVTVVDQNGNTLAANGTASGGANGSSSDQAAAYDSKTKSAIQSMLDSVLGAGNSTVTVSADISQASGSSTTTSYSTPSGAPATSESSDTEAYSGSAAANAASGVLGTDTTSSGTGSSGNGGSYVSKKAVKDNALDKTVETKTITPGTLNRQTIAVAINSDKASGYSTATIQSLVAAAAGVNASRGDLVTVAAMSFSKSAAAQAKQALAQSQAQASSSSMMQLIQTAVTVVGALAGLVILLVFIRRLFAKTPAPEPVDGGLLQAVPATVGGQGGFEQTLGAGGADAPIGGRAPQMPTAPSVGAPSFAPTGTTATLTRPAPATVATDDPFAQLQADVDALADDPERAAEYLKALMDDRADA